MATMNKGRLRQSAQDGPSDPRVTIRFSPDIQKALAAWARTEGRSLAEQARLLVEQAVVAREDRLALTRR